jgi:multiple sugar transport system permease protein
VATRLSKTRRRGVLPWRTAEGLLTYVLLAGMLVIALFPVYWMLVTSLKPARDVYSLVPQLWPKSPTLTPYRTLFERTDFALFMKNSLVVSLATTAFTLLIATLAAYAIARIPFRGTPVLSRGILFAYLMPQSVLFIPLYILLARLKLDNTLTGLVLIYPTITVPYATWILIGYFRSIPQGLVEAALVDGCSQLAAMARIVLPLAGPGLVATGVFSFTLCWSEYMYALVAITNEQVKTLTLGLQGMIVADVPPWGQLMAGAVLATLPVVVLYTAASRYLVTGLTLGAVKE